MYYSKCCKVPVTGMKIEDSINDLILCTKCANPCDVLVSLLKDFKAFHTKSMTDLLPKIGGNLTDNHL